MKSNYKNGNIITIRYADGGVYIGEHKDDKAHGQGLFKNDDGGVYIGEHKDDKRHGQGIFTWADGSFYEGNYKDGLKCGQGTLKYANGNEYQGEWENNKIHGQGKYIWKSGNEYEGEWKDNKKHGIGTFTHANKEIIASAKFVDGAINYSENFGYVIIKQGSSSCFIYQHEGKFYYQKLDQELSKEEAEELYKKKQGSEIDSKSYKRLAEILMQLCSPDIAIQNKDYKKVENPAEFQEHIEKIKASSQGGNAVINTIGIPGHAFTVLAEKGKVTIYDNGGLKYPICADYNNVIEQDDDIKYRIIKSNLELKFKAQNEVVNIKFKNEHIVCRHKANIICQKLKEIREQIGDGDLIAEGFDKYICKQKGEVNMDSDNDEIALEDISMDLKTEVPANQVNPSSSKKFIESLSSVNVK